MAAEHEERTLLNEEAERSVLEPPRVVGGRYELGARIGSGGQGAVYRAFDRALKREVAVKLIDADDEESSGRFSREAKNLSNLVHDNIVRYFGSERVDGRSALVMELIEGGNLRDAIRDRLPEMDSEARIRFVVEVTIQVCDALTHAHTHKMRIVHRDIKPENILLTLVGERWLVKVSDFGLSKRTGDAPANMTRTLAHLTQEGAVQGTPGYITPEQIQGQKPLPSVDLYSLGVVMFEALTGRLPFVPDPSNPLAVFLDHLHKPPPAFRAVSADLQHPALLETIVHRLLEKRPEKRHPSAAALKAELLDLVERLERGDMEAVSSEIVYELAGRREELDRLREAFGRARALIELGEEEEAPRGERAGAVFVLGDAGLGRTRLLYEAQGSAVCFHLRVRTDLFEVAEDIVARRPELREQLGRARGELETLRQGSRRKLVDVLTALLTRLTVTDAVALHVDDLDALDPAVAEDVVAVAAALSGRPFVLVASFGTSRPGARALAWVCQRRLRSVMRVETIELRRLEEADAEKLCRAVVGEGRSEAQATIAVSSGALQKASARAAEEHAEGGNGRTCASSTVDSAAISSVVSGSLGNPALLVVLAQGLRGGGSDGLPTTVLTLFERWLAGLSAAELAVARGAAVLGGEITAPMLRALGGDVLSCLTALADRGFLAEAVSPAGSRFSFPSELLALSLEGAVRGRDRLRIYECASAWVRYQKPGDCDMWFGDRARDGRLQRDLARWLAEGGKKDQALQPAAESARQAEAAHRNHAALEAWEYLLGLNPQLEESDAPLFIEAHTRIGRLAYLCEKAPRAEEALEIARRAAEAHGDKVLLARAIRETAGYCRRTNRLPEACTHLERAAAMLSAAANRAEQFERAHVAAQLAECHQLLRHNTTALELTRDVVLFARQEQDPSLLALALGVQGECYRVEREVEQAQRAYEEAAAVACDAGLDSQLFHVRKNQGLLHVDSHNYALGEQYSTDALQVAIHVGNPLLVAQALNNRGHANHYQGNLLGSARDYRAAVRIYRELRRSQHLAIALYNLAEIVLKTGHLDEAFLIAEEAVYFGKGTPLWLDIELLRLAVLERRLREAKRRETVSSSLGGEIRAAQQVVEMLGPRVAESGRPDLAVLHCILRVRLTALVDLDRSQFLLSDLRGSIPSFDSQFGLNTYAEMVEILLDLNSADSQLLSPLADATRVAEELDLLWERARLQKLAGRLLISLHLDPVQALSYLDEAGRMFLAMEAALEMQEVNLLQDSALKLISRK
jgi:serine/threonine-protein kinase